MSGWIRGWTKMSSEWQNIVDGMQKATYTANVTVADRDNSGKPQMWYTLLFPRTAEALARVLEQGAKKYSRLNFAKGGKDDEEYLSAAMRHLTMHCRYYITDNADDMYDKETGCLHLAQAIWNLQMLIDFNRVGLHGVIKEVE